MKIDTTTGIESDIDRETARRAFYNTSHSPERRGDSVIQDYINDLKSLSDYITGAAQDERQKAIAQSVFDGLRAKYRAKTQKWIWAQSRCLSSFIVGPANFPVRRAEKANRAERARADDLLHFSRNMRQYALKALDGVFTNSEKRDAATESLRAQIAEAEARQEFMKTANALHRKKDMDGLKAHFSGEYGTNCERILQEFLKPNYTNRIGFEDWKLSNNLANIKRMKARLAELEAKAENAGKELSK